MQDDTQAVTGRRTEVVAADIRRKIQAGNYPPGHKLPGVTDLLTEYAGRLGVTSRSTIQAALRQLAEEGLLSSVHGVGTFVRAQRRIRRNLVGDLRMEYERALTGDDREGMFEVMTGIDDAAVTPSHRFIPAAGDLAGKLAVEPGTLLLERAFHYAVNGTPYQIVRFYMTAELAELAGLPQAERKGLGSLAHLHAAGVALERATFSIVMRRPSQGEAKELAIPAGTWVVESSRMVFGDGRPVEVSDGIVAADQVEYFVDIPVKEGQS